MIDKMTDYKWVNIPQDMIIDGGIMPKRENKNLLRGEDVCFLLESMAEIYLVTRHSNVTYGMDRRILGNRYAQVINFFKFLVLQSTTQSGKPLKDEQWAKYYNLDSTSSLSPAYLDSSKIVELGDLKADAADFARGKPLNQYKVMNIFEDQSLLKTFQLYQPQYNLMLNVSYRIDKTGDREVHEDVRPPYTWYYRTQTYWDGNAEKYASEKTVLNGGYFSYDPYYSLTADPQFVKSAIVFIQLYLNVRKYNNGRQSSSTFNRFYPIEATVANGRFVLDSQLVVSAVNEFIDDQHLNFNPLNTNNGVTRGFMDMNAWWSVINLGDRTRWDVDDNGGN